MGKKVLIYHNPMCSKSREALSILEANGLQPTIIEYLKNSPSEKEIQELLGKLSLTAIQLVRKNEDLYKTLIHEKNLSEDEIISIISKNPKLIERPIVIQGRKAIIGRPPALVLELVG